MQPLSTVDIQNRSFHVFSAGAPAPVPRWRRRSPAPKAQGCICQIFSGLGFIVFGFDIRAGYEYLVEDRSQCWILHLGGSTGEGGVKINLLNLFRNISRGSDILGNVSNPHITPP